MGNDKLAQYIASLSDEERKKYKHLIEDALRLDGETVETFTEAKARAVNYAESLKRLREESMLLKASLTTLTEKLSEVADASERALRVFSQGPSWN